MAKIPPSFPLSQVAPYVRMYPKTWSSFPIPRMRCPSLPEETTPDSITILFFWDQNTRLWSPLRVSLLLVLLFKCAY